ncbi:MAG: thermonuclease family protein [Myxococcales bacterium]|nr:thermonuclease family protein [Myxococcales bacterium]MDH3482800.1 thermonuclease family protein [Myxococcales bacterium]
MHFGGRIVCLVVWTCLVGYGCGRDATAEGLGTPTGAAATNSAADPVAGDEEPAEVMGEGLVIGEYRLAPRAVIDGDTIRVENLEGSIRLLSIDTEEAIRSKRDRAAIKADFDEYLKRKQGDAVRPRKAGTPMGNRAIEFAERFFEGADVVRLERDDPKALRGRYGRLLAYAFVQKDGKWTIYNVEAVRAGMSPYFTKYGYSHRFHNQFARAETEARRARRGIWDPNAEGYGDYAVRKDWWDARADFIQAFEHQATGRDDLVVLNHWDAKARLEKMLGDEVTLLGTVDKVEHFRGLVRVVLGGEQANDFPIIFREKEIFDRSDLARYRGEPVTVRGRVERYERGDYQTLQIVVGRPKQIGLPSLPWPGEPALAAE